MFNQIRRFVNEEDGLAATEYALVLAVIAVIAYSAFDDLGGKVNDSVEAMNDEWTVPTP